MFYFRQSMLLTNQGNKYWSSVYALMLISPETRFEIPTKNTWWLKNSEHWGVCAVVCGYDKMSLSQSIEISFSRFCAPFAFWQAKYPSLRANIRISSIMMFSFQRQRPINKLDAPNIFTLVDIQLNWCPINTPINSNGDSVPWQLIPCLINRICKTIGSNRSY